MRFGVLLVAAVLLAGCAESNTNIRNIQFSGAENTLPPDYLDRAAKAVAGLTIAPNARRTFSEPRTLVGKTAFAPKRWYVCAVGLLSPGPKPVSAKPLFEFIDEALFGAHPQGRYDVAVIFDQAALTSLWKGYDAQICDG